MKNKKAMLLGALISVCAVVSSVAAVGELRLPDGVCGSLDCGLAEALGCLPCPTGGDVIVREGEE